MWMTEGRILQHAEEKPEEGKIREKLVPSSLEALAST
jgi:hypothetical protein